MKSTFYHEAETKQKLVDFISNSEILSMNQQCQKFEATFPKNRDANIQ
jgi:CDP-4-dehydro-6-deoxyglucose reductase, E1